MNSKLIITLLNLPKISRKTVQLILNCVAFESLDNDHIQDKIKQVSKIHKRIIVPSINEIISAKNKADNIIKESLEKGINIISLLDNDFPQKLKKIKDYPVIIYYKGNIDCLHDENCISIIGSRDASEYSLSISKRLGTIFAENDYVIVSGLAQGCDENAHLGCLSTGGKTVAILPSSLDQIYPPKSKDLAELIVKNNGCLVTEYPVGSTIHKGNFIERDRLQSAFAKALIVVAAKPSSGTMHTVTYAKNTDCLIGCYYPVSPDKLNEDFKGNKELIESSIALQISSKTDIEEFKQKISTVPQSYKEDTHEQLKLF